MRFVCIIYCFFAALLVSDGVVATSADRSLAFFRPSSPLVTTKHASTKMSYIPSQIASNHGIYVRGGAVANDLPKALAGAGADYTSTAINYFSSVRVPASMITGAALSVFFSLASKSRDSEAKNRSQIETFVLIIYHMLTLTSLLLSLNTIVTSTAAAASLMFGVENPIATNAFELMKREFEFEFLMTRWSFYVSLFALLGAIATRALIEFDLLQPDRTRSAVLVISAFAGLLFHLLSFVNERIFYYNNMTEMTWDVLSMWYTRSIAGGGVCELASIGCFICSVVAGISLFFRAGKFSSSGDESKVKIVSNL
jgi:hypothetical protein